jgi:hypothetical protein
MTPLRPKGKPWTKGEVMILQELYPLATKMELRGFLIGRGIRLWARLVAEESNLYGEMSAWDNLMFIGELYG